MVWILRIILSLTISTFQGLQHSNQNLSFVACVTLQCIPCFHECRCMSDEVFIQFVCQLL